MDVMDRMRAAYGTMSKSHQKIVHYYQGNQRDLLFDSLAAFSQKAGSSEATVVRFAHQLGYSGYTDLQKSLQDEVLAGVFQPLGGGQMAGAKSGAPGAAFATEVQANHIAMQQMYAELDADAFEHAADVLMQAESVIIIGYMESFGMGSQALHMLDEIRGNVTFSRLLGDPNEVFRHIRPGTAILGVSFRKHYKFTHELLQMGHDKGCNITLITDGARGPLAQTANQVLLARPHHDIETGLTDVSAPMHLLYSLVRRMALKYPGKVAEYQRISLRRWEEFVE